MNREILFREKRVDNGAWETGSLIRERMQTGEERVFIADKMTGYHTPVIPETIGQFIGRCDRNGKKIFEGDIVEHTTFHDEKIRTGVVEYIGKYGAFFITGSGYSDNQMYAFCNFKVVGNVFDNPKLLKGENYEDE